MPFHVAGHRVGPVLVGGAHRQYLGQALGVLAQQRVVAAVAQGAPQVAQRRVQRILFEAVVGGDAGPAVAHQPDLLQPRQVGGDPRLGQAGHGRQLGDGQLLALKQGEQAHARGVGQDLEPHRPGFQIHRYLRIAI